MSETLIHEISLTGYKATSTASTLDLGTWGSYGIEKLHLTLDAAWQNLTITAFFNVKGEVVAKTVVGKDGYADVPWEATKENTFAGRIVFEGSLDGQRRVSSDLNFKVTNHSSIADVDSVPTVDRWNQFVTQNKEYRDGAYEAATKAEARAEDAAAASEDAQASMRAAKASADAAARSETNASASERAAAGSAAAAATSEGNAAESAKNAASAAKNAAASKSAADTLAAEAARAALAAEESKAAANAAANLAGENATAAQQAAGVATAAANDAGQSASDAAASKAAAETAAQAAQEAQTAAAAAKADAVKAQTAAQAAAKTAKDAQSAAEKARDDAQTARQGAESARDAAAGSAEAAAKSEENAKQSADTLAEAVENVAANTAAVAELREKKAEIDDTAVGADGWSSKHIVDMLCPKIEESGNPVQCYPVAGYPLGVKASWEPVQEGEGEPSPENIRPIVGRGSVTVERCGENLLDPRKVTHITYNPYGLTVQYVEDNRIHLQGTYSTEGGSFVIMDTNQSLLAGRGLQIYGVVVDGKAKPFSLYGLRTANETVIAMQTIDWKPGDAVEMTIAIVVTNSTTAPTTYTPYIGQTNTLTMPETVYGGSVDAVSGEGQETWKQITLNVDDMDGTDNFPGWNNQAWAFDVLPPNVDTSLSGKIATSMIPSSILRGSTRYNGQLYWEANGETQSEYKEKHAGKSIQVCYKLATPVPFTATGGAALPALAGVNTVITDADSVAVSGRADPIKRIEDLEAAVASIN